MLGPCSLHQEAWARNVWSTGSVAALLSLRRDAPDAGIKAELEAVLQYGHAAKDGALSVQAVFTLIDVLKQWIKVCMADAGELCDWSDLDCRKTGVQRTLRLPSC